MTSGDFTKYRFSLCPWNIHPESGLFGLSVREEFGFEDKIKFYKDLGF